MSIALAVEPHWVSPWVFACEEGRASATKLCEVASRAIGEFVRRNIVQSELAFVLHRLILNGDPCPDDVRAWATEQWQRPTVREFVERKRPIG